MQGFNYKKVHSIDQALNAQTDQMRFLAGGTTLIDLMKLEVETPHTVIDINALPFSKIEEAKGGLLIGAMVKNAELAQNETVKKSYTVLSQALLSGASPQLRNKATTSGNLLQRTRCVYFRDPLKPCNKRQPGSGCSALQGFNRNLAILGTSDACIASHPSDMNVAMTALEATVHVQSIGGKRDIAIADFYLLPGSTPDKETVLKPGDLITGVSLPHLPEGTKSVYLKLRDRASYEFALASTAVVASGKNGKFDRVRVAMGGIGTKPWRSLEAEKILLEGAATEEMFRKAAEEFMKGAKPQSQNGFKVELAKRCFVQALKQTVKA